METFQIPIKRAVFEKLQTLATPLVDDANSVIERLIEHWEKNPPTESMQEKRSLPRYWTSSRGEKLAIGAKLRSNYLEKDYFAEVTSGGISFDGKMYANPSAAGAAVKRSAGTRGKATETNGWDFWDVLLPGEQTWTPLRSQRNATSK